MNKNILKILPVMMAGALLLSGCSSTSTSSTTEVSKSADPPSSYVVQTTASTVTTSLDISETDSSNDYFSSRDLSGDIDYTDAVEITLNGNSASCSSDGVTISGSVVTISKEGAYILSGTLSDGYIVVNTSKEEKVQLVLNGVSITSDTFAPIYVAQADKVFVTLVDGSKNTLANGGSFIAIDDSNVDAVIFSRDDITFNGTGSLSISSPSGKGIVGKDEVTFTAGTYQIDSSGACIRANDSVAIADGTYTLTSDKDGIHAQNNDDDSLGNVYIAGGTFNIYVGDDGIHATTLLQIDDGTMNVTAYEGLEATYVVINGGTISISASDDGINAAQKSSLYTPTIEINGGDITVVMGSGDTDGIDSNGDIIVNGGTVNVTGNSTFDYNGTGTINGGTVIVNGQEVTTMPSQMMGGHGGMGGHGSGSWNGGTSSGSTNGNSNNSGSIDGSTDNSMMGHHGGMGGHGGFDNSSPDATTSATVTA